MPPVLLFDVMDTLIYNPFNHEIPAFFGLTQAELLAQKHPTAWIQFELGEIDEPEFLATYFADGRPFDCRRFLRVVDEAYRWVEGAEPLLQELHGLGRVMHAFSNYPTWYRTIESRFGLSRYLEWSFVSCRTGLRKPDAAAFAHAVDRLQRAPQDCLLIDDSVVNCSAAEALGMPAIRFTGNIALRRELHRRGVLG